MTPEPPHPSVVAPAQESGADRAFQLAIDGPAGAGKSTVARGVAHALGFLYLDTGAMYRAVGLKASRLSASHSHPDWGAVAEGADLQLQHTPDGQRIILDGEDVTNAIRTPDVSRWSSVVSADTRVRETLTERMRLIAESENVVMEGRDIGTVVLPRARLKIFLTAPEEERARRRALELERRGEKVDEVEVRREMAERDDRDARRADSPLVKASDAVEVDTAGLSADEVITRIVQMARERM